MGCGASRVTPAPAAASSRHTRVLWDIENVSIPSSVDAFQLVAALERWLAAQGLWGPNVDGLISCFYNPHNPRFTRALSTLLDRAGVEQVLAGQKREDADRKICARLDREAAVLPCSSTAFVLISSDMDFAAPMRRLVQAGFASVVLLHAAPAGSQQEATLSHAATSAHKWAEVLLDVPTAPTQPAAAVSSAVPAVSAATPPVADAAATPTSAGAGAGLDAADAVGGGASSGDDDDGDDDGDDGEATTGDEASPAQRKRRRRRKRRGGGGGGGGTEAEGGAAPTASRTFDVGVRYAGVCQLWHKSKGWGWLELGDAAGGRLYCNASELPAAVTAAAAAQGTRPVLSKGTEVAFSVAHDDRSRSRAVAVELVAAAAGE